MCAIEDPIKNCEKTVVFPANPQNLHASMHLSAAAGCAKLKQLTDSLRGSSWGSIEKETEDVIEDVTGDVTEDETEDVTKDAPVSRMDN